MIMASSGHAFLFFKIAIFCFTVIPTLPATRVRFKESTIRGAGFSIELKRIDSESNLTKFELVQRALIRGRKRLQRLNAVVLRKSIGTASSLRAPVHAGDGEFLMTLSIGTPPRPFSAIVDTGSDLIWTQCQPCTRCYNQPTPVFDPRNSSTFSNLPCSSELCQRLPTSFCYDDLCQYTYEYGDQSFTDGSMASEKFTFGTASVPGIGFGCGVDNEGIGFGQGAGLVGLGRGPLSLVSQLDEPKFSYCLASQLSPNDHERPRSSTLLMGSMASDLTGVAADRRSMIKTTPLVQNPLQPSFYYVTLKGITVGHTRLPINESEFAMNEDGTGGVVLDSGTTLTYLLVSAYEVLKEEFISQTNLSPVNGSSSGLDLCFEVPSDKGHVRVPGLVFHFDNADMAWPSENYLIRDTRRKEICVALGGSVGMSIIGNILQQNFLVIHDLEKETVSFVSTLCG